MFQKMREQEIMSRTMNSYCLHDHSTDLNTQT